MAEYRKRRAANGEQQERLRGRLQISGQAGQTVAEAGEIGAKLESINVPDSSLFERILTVLGKP